MWLRHLLVAAALASAGAGPAWGQPVVSREQLNAVVWQQRSAEYRALATAAWRQATARLPGLRSNGRTASLEQRAAGGFANKPPAVVLDVDETVLDNTAFNAMLLREGRDYDPRDWDLWVAGRRAGAVPGAREFVQRARALGFRVVYVTNRECNPAGGYDAQGRALDCPQKAATIDNLDSAIGHRPAAADVMLRYEVMGRDDASDKGPRRAAVAATHRIALLAGDDLNDFVLPARYDPAQHAAFWGATGGAPWVALPNPIYGSWDRDMRRVEQKYAALDAWQPPAQPPSARLAVVSWNLAWFADPALLVASGFWTQCAALGFPNTRLRDDLPFCDVYKRDAIATPADYAAKKVTPLRQRLAELAASGMDILAVQETGSPAALMAVLPPGYVIACFTTQASAQNLGFAMRVAAGLQATCREVRPLSQEDNPAIDRPVRRGLELVVTTPGAAPRTLALLNVHLKASCPTGRLDGGNANCITLRAQAPALEAWIEEQAGAGRPFAVIGDWNRDIEAEAASGFPARSDGSNPQGPLDVAKLRNLWPEINDGQPAASLMLLPRVDRSAAGVALPDAPADAADATARAALADAAGDCHAILDQLAVSASLQAQLTRESLVDGRLTAALLPRPRGASDHCPLRVELLYR
jgi:acid phosphatase